MERAPKLGKALLDSIIEGMYADSFFVFREYIQNSSDSIDDAVEKGFLRNQRAGNIELKLGSDFIEIKDNGIAVTKNKFIDHLVDIGASVKDPKKKERFSRYWKVGWNCIL